MERLNLNLLSALAALLQERNDYLLSARAKQTVVNK